MGWWRIQRGGAIIAAQIYERYYKSCDPHERTNSKQAFFASFVRRKYLCTYIMQEIAISFHEASWTRQLYDSLHHYRSLHFYDTLDVNWFLDFYLHNTLHLDYSFYWHFHHSLDLHYSLDQFLHKHWHLHTFLHCHLYNFLHNFLHLHRHFHFNYAFDFHLNHTLYLHRHFHSALYQHFPLHENGHFHLFHFECGISQAAHCRMRTLQYFSRRSGRIASARIGLERDCQAGDSLSK